MTPDELKQLCDKAERLANAATPGPWERIGTSICDWGDGTGTYSMEFLPNLFSERQTDDAEFIAHARTAVPQLIAAVRELQAENEALRHGVRC